MPYITTGFRMALWKDTSTRSKYQKSSQLHCAKSHRHPPEKQIHPDDNAMAADGIRQRSRQFTASQQARNPFHHDGEFQKIIRKGPIFLAICLLVGVPFVLFNVMRTELKGDEIKWKLRDNFGSPRADTSQYTGKLWKTEQTLGRTLLGETEYARCDVHSVVSEDHKSIVNDWIFLEERDHVNVAVYTKGGKFLLFQQRKYAIPGVTLSPVGGFIDDKETPFDAARREVVEELGVGSRHTAQLLKRETKGKKFSIPVGNIKVDEYDLAIGDVPLEEQSQWVFLGRYRTAANRGGGFLYTYLLVDAIPVVESGGTQQYIGRGDSEEQTLISMSKGDVASALLQGRFQEAKWTATLSLSLLHMQKQEMNTQRQ